MLDCCKKCVARAPWSYRGPGEFCFGAAYFLGKPQRAIPLEEIKTCPIPPEKKGG
jgi:hypothetical protein